MKPHHHQPRLRQPLPPSRRKWTKGESPIASLEELIALIEAGNYIFDRERHVGYHPSVIENWQFQTIRNRIRWSQLFPGVRNLTFPYVFEAVWHQATNGADPKLSRYFVGCYELGSKCRFEAKSRDYISTTCRDIVKRHTDGKGRCVVQFNDEERP